MQLKGNKSFNFFQIEFCVDTTAQTQNLKILYVRLSYYSLLNPIVDTLAEVNILPFDIFQNDSFGVKSHTNSTNILIFYPCDVTY